MLRIVVAGCGASLLKRRIPLNYGTLVLFDSAQPHGVLKRGKATFEGTDFEEEPFEMFLSLDMTLVSEVRSLLGIELRCSDLPADHFILQSDTISEINLHTGFWRLERAVSCLAVA